MADSRICPPIHQSIQHLLVLHVSNKSPRTSLFETGEQILNGSKAPWIGSVFLASIMSYLAAWFFLRSRGDEIYERNKK